MKNIIPSEKFVKQFLVECECSFSVIRFGLFDDGQSVIIENLSSSQPNHDKKSINQTLVMKSTQLKEFINILCNLDSIQTKSIIFNDDDFVFKISVFDVSVNIIYYSTTKRFYKDKYEFDFIVKLENVGIFIDNLKELICD